MSIQATKNAAARSNRSAPDQNGPSSSVNLTAIALTPPKDHDQEGEGRDQVTAHARNSRADRPHKLLLEAGPDASAPLSPQTLLLEKQIEAVDRFPDQNPNPVLRISAKGT